MTQCGTSNPVANATVTVDGNNYGVTNASGVLDATLTPGSHAWVVSKTGWSSANNSVSITDGVTTNVSPCLNSGTAHFVVTNCSTSAPLQGATVTVDGTVMGQTNASGVLDVPLVPGSHNWVVTRNNYSQAQNSVNDHEQHDDHGPNMPVAKLLRDHLLQRVVRRHNGTGAAGGLVNAGRPGPGSGLGDVEHGWRPGAGGRQRAQLGLHRRSLGSQ